MFDCDAFFDALDAERLALGLDWNQVAVELGQVPLCSTHSSWITRFAPERLYGCAGGARSPAQTDCRRRWLDRAPEDFLDGPVVDVGEVELPEAGPDSRLRWNLSEIYAELDQERTAWVSMRGSGWRSPSTARRAG